MLGNYRVAAQLAASRVVLSSTELVLVAVAQSVYFACGLTATEFVYEYLCRI
jgi:hypothetical protein